MELVVLSTPSIRNAVTTTPCIAKVSRGIALEFTPPPPPHQPTPSPCANLLLHSQNRFLKKAVWLGNTVYLVDRLSIRLRLGRRKIDALQFRKTLHVTSFEIGLEFADPLPASDPPLSVRGSALVGDLVQRWPIRRVIVLEIDLAAVSGHQLGWRDVAAEVFVELQLLASEWVDEGRDELEEAPYRPGNYIQSLVYSSGCVMGRMRTTVDDQCPP